MEVAELGIEKLIDSVDSMIVIPNEKLLEIEDEDIDIEDAYKKVDEVLLMQFREYPHNKYSWC